MSYNKRWSRRVICLIGLVSLAIAPTAGGEDWGDLTGKFTFVGAPPKAAAINVPMDSPDGICRTANLVDESLVVGKDGGLANVVIYLRTPAAGKVAVHADYKAHEADPAMLDNKGCRFEPHVLAMRTSQPLKLNNSDPMAHNSKLNAVINAEANPIIPSGAAQNLKLPLVENLPIKVTCNIHGWMNGFIVVREDPYFAVTDASGKFEIKNIPVGDYEFQLWQERSGYVKEATIGGKAVTIDRGRLKQKIAKGANDLGEIKVDAKVFDPK